MKNEKQKEKGVETKKKRGKSEANLEKKKEVGRGGESYHLGKVCTLKRLESGERSGSLEYHEH